MALALRKALDSIPIYRPGGCPEEQGEKTAVKLSSNECPWEPPACVINAIMDAAHTLNRYPDFYKEELAEKLGEFYHVPATHIAIDNGSGTLLQDVVRIVADQDDEVIFATPSFAAYEIDVVLAGAKPVKVPLNSAYEHDLPAMSQAVTENTKLIMICNPNNPTGTFVSAEQLRSFLQSVPDTILVVVDEAYHEFVTAEDQNASLALLDEFDNLLIMRTFSKAFGLAGMRIGYCLAAPNVIDALNKTVAEFSVSTIAQAAALACLEPEALDIMWERTHAIIEERENLQEKLADAGIDFIPSQSNFIMLPRDSAAGFDLLANNGVICRPFNNPEGIRITVGTHENMVLVERALGLE